MSSTAPREVKPYRLFGEDIAAKPERYVLGQLDMAKEER